MAIRAPASDKKATALLERYAELEGQIATIEEERNSSIATINALADDQGAALIRERGEIHAALKPWWESAAGRLLNGKRKSVEIGGCIVGSRMGRDSLAVEGEEKAIVAALQKRSWAEPLLRMKVTLDRAAILKSIDGVYRKQLLAMGLSRKAAEDTFFIERTEQGRTQAGVDA